MQLHCKGSCQKKTFFFWEISPKCGWVGWLTPKQGPNPSKPPQITPKIALFDPNFTFRSPKSHKNPGVGGWVNRFGRDLPKKTVFFGQPPLRNNRTRPNGGIKQALTKIVIKLQHISNIVIGIGQTHPPPLHLFQIFMIRRPIKRTKILQNLFQFSKKLSILVGGCRP